MKRNAARSTGEKLWWTRPSAITFGFLIPIVTIIFIGRNSNSDVVNYFDIEHYLLAIASLGVVAVFSLIGEKFVPKNTTLKIHFIDPTYLDYLALLSIGAYSIWFFRIIANPSYFINIILGQAGAFYAVRSDISTIPGITTLTQLGVVYVTIYTYDRLRLAAYRPKHRYQVYYWLIIGLALLRSFVWSERLAFIEVILPIVVLQVVWGQKGRLPMKLMRKYGPYLGLIGLVVFFTIMEYFRSWVSHYSQYDSSLVRFGIERINNYYYTALNNGAGFLEKTNWPDFHFYYLFEFLYRMPIVGSILSPSTTGRDITSQFLVGYANPEFNNMSGIFTVFHDVGYFAFIYFALVGILLGAAYKSFQRGSGFVGYYYPLLFIVLLELIRISYLTSTRMFPILLFISLAALFTRKLHFRRVEESVWLLVNGRIDPRLQPG